MLYIGEGYIKILLVNGGKIRWTYSTGPGWEYDGIWMLSNGRVLFTPMQYVAETKPERRWFGAMMLRRELNSRLPAYGQAQILLILNGLPPRMMLVNSNTRAMAVNHVLPA